MSGNKKPYRLISEEELKQYLKGELKGKAAHDIERRALEDDFEGEALDGWQEHEVGDLESDLVKLRRKVKQSQKSQIVWWQVAAVLALLMVAGFVLWSLSDQLAREQEVAQEMPSTEELKSEDQEKQITKEDEGQSSKPSEARPVKARMEQKPSRSKPEKLKQEMENQALDILKDSDVKNEETEGKEESTERFAFSDEPTSGFGDADETEDNVALEEVVIESIELDSFDMAAADSPEISNKNAVSITQSLRAVPVKSVDKNADDVSVEQMNRIIRGVVISEDGEPVPGANVLVVGKNKGAITDLDGRFKLEVDPFDELLEVAFVGYETAKVSVADSIEVMLNEDVTTLSEVVVVGYATQKKSNLTGAATTVDIEEDYADYQKPFPEGGMTDFKTYLEEQIRIPDSAVANGITGMVKLKVTILPNGRIGEIQVKKSLGFGCDEEAIRLVKEGPKWRPALQEGVPVSSEVKVKVKFDH